MRISLINQPQCCGGMQYRRASQDRTKSADRTSMAGRDFDVPVVFTANIHKKCLSAEIKKAFESKDEGAKQRYFANLLNNHSLVFRNCSDDEYIKSVQVLLDNVHKDKYTDKEMFENQVKLLSALVRPDAEMASAVNPEKFSENMRNLVYNDDCTVNKINRILQLTGAKDSKITLDISSHSKYPVNLLSNFADTDFVFGGYRIKSMEGFLQSLKTQDVKEQEYICSLDGLRAKGMGKKLNKQRNYSFKNLFWHGEKIKRDSAQYQNLIKSAYKERFNNDDDFRFALEYTKNYNLAHSIGVHDPKRTLLTEQEFIGILNDLREG